MKRSLFLLSLLVTACGAAPAVADSPFETLGRNPQVFVLDTARGDVTRVTDDDAGHTSLAWSRAGKLAFQSSQPMSVAIEVVSRDGSGRRVLVRERVLGGHGLVWSPDGTQLAFSTFVVDGQRQRIETVAADGSGQTRVAEYVVPWIGPTGPSWSPDGTRLTYARGFGTGPPRVPRGQPPLAPAVIPGTMKIVVSDVAGRSERRLTRLGGDEWDPQWSPRGTSILFARRTRGERGARGVRVGLFTASPGKKVRMLADDLIFIYDAAWSPDGRTVALLATLYAGDRRTRLLVVDVGTRRVRTLAHGDVASAAPSWSPDSRRVAYATSKGIRTVSVADGKSDLVLSVPAEVDQLAWSPDGAWLALTARRVPDD